MKPRFLGLDLAWSANNPSGLAALDGEGRLIALSADVVKDDEIVGWVRAHLGDRGAIAIDMPTIVRNANRQRDCERDLRAEFRAHDAGPYPANLGLQPFEGGGRAHRLIAALADSVVHACDVLPADPRTVAFEVFPHPAMIELFELPRIVRYKKKGRRPWDGPGGVLAEWSRYRSLLASLAGADPALIIGPEIDLPPAVSKQGYKRRDDELDAILCAYVASYVWRHGTTSPRVKVYGDMIAGHIVVPWGRGTREAGASRVQPHT